MYRVYADGESIFDPEDRSYTLHSPKVTQELGKAGTFQFVIPPTNSYYNELRQMITTIVVEYEIGATTLEIFRGRVFNTSTDFSKMKTVVCEGSLAYLVDTVQRATSYKGSAKNLLKKILSRHNQMVIGRTVSESDWSSLSAEVRRKLFKFGKYEIDDATVIIPGPKEDDDAYYGSKYEKAIVEAIEDEWLTTYDFINSVILEYLGGYLVARYDKSTGANYLDIVSDESLKEDPKASDGANRQIEFGSNLLDLSEEHNPEDLCTVVIPLGDSVDDKALTIENSSDAKNNKTSSGYEVVEYGGKRIGIKHISAAKKYGCIYKTHSFSNVNDANTLFLNGKNWLRANRRVPTRYTVKAIDLRFVDDASDSRFIRLGEMISISSPEHDLDSELLCTKIEYDLENPANNAYSLGNPEQTLTERYRKDKNKEDKQSKSRSRKSGGSASGKAGAAQDTADEIAEKLAGAEITVDPDNASITLATWYKVSSDAMRRAGIDIEGKKGSVDIYAIDEGVTRNEARLTVLSNELETSINAQAQRSDGINSALAQLTLRTTDLESVVSQLASYESETNLSTASITAKADANGSMIDSLAEFRDKATDQLIGMVELKLEVDKDHSEISALTQHASETTEGIAQLNLRVDDTMSLIEQIANFISESAETTASIKTKADANGAYIDMLTEYKNKVTGELQGLAQTKQWVDDHSANIQQATEWYSQNGTSALTKLAQFSDDKISKIEQATKFYTENSSALSSIKNWTDETSANVVSAAQYVNTRSASTGNRDLTTTLAGTRAKANASHALWTAFATWTDDETGKVNMASIELNADKFGSVIEAHATTIKSYAKKVVIDSGENGFLKYSNGQVTISRTLSVQEGSTFGKKITAGGGLEVTGGYLTVRDEDGTSIVATRSWVENKLKDYLKKSTFDGHKHSLSLEHDHSISAGSNRTGKALYKSSNYKTGGA